MIREHDVHIIVRLANEEVPVNAIARSLQHPSDEVRETIEEAMLYGTVLAMPRADWHPLQRGNRGVISKLTDEEWVQNCQRTFRLTRLHAAFLSVIIRRNEVSRDQLHQVIEGCRRQPQDTATNVKMVDVVLCNLRKRIKPFGLIIKTLHSSGYYMAPEFRKKTQDMVLARLNGETDGTQEGAPAPTKTGDNGAVAS
jgi:hypothetical protein